MLGAKAINSTSPSAEPSGGRSGAAASVSYRMIVSVQGGLHRGAAFVSDASESVFIGSSPHCDLVLMDEGVPGHAMCIFVRDRRLAVKVIAAGVSAGERVLAQGVKVFEEPSAVLRVGGASFKVELLRRSRRLARGSGRTTASPGHGRQGRTILAWAGLSAVLVLAAGAGAVNASFDRDFRRAGRTLDEVVALFNAKGAEITIGAAPGGLPLLQGFVADAAMRERLGREVAAAGLRAELRLRDVGQMADSLTRLARLSDHRCEARHLGGGRFECDAGAVGTQAAGKLRALAAQVPGVVALDVRSIQPESPAPTTAPPVAADAAPPPERPPAPRVHPQLPEIRHIAMGHRDRFAIDANGRKLRVGDTAGDARVVQIRFDAVELSLEGQAHTVLARPLLARAAN